MIAPDWLEESAANRIALLSFTGMGASANPGRPESFKSEAARFGVIAADDIMWACRVAYRGVDDDERRQAQLDADVRSAVALARTAHRYWLAYRYWEFFWQWPLMRPWNRSFQARFRSI